MQYQQSFKRKVLTYTFLNDIVLHVPNWLKCTLELVSLKVSSQPRKILYGKKTERRETKPTPSKFALLHYESLVGFFLTRLTRSSSGQHRCGFHMTSL